MIKYVIPARRNSKGLPFKNRKLITYTLDSLPKNVFNNVILTTDDEKLLEIGAGYGINCVNRDPSLAQDETSTKSVMLDLKNRGIINDDDIVIMLYLTYPQRNWLDITNTLHFFNENGVKSLLCKKEINGTHPYLYLLETGNFMGKQLVEHNLYRRQDYPKVFEISHFISIFSVSELENLNDNLYNNNTIFYPIDDVVDVDTEKDLNKFISI
jgi:CMP-N,N'-diacetyllegionaminic acid synthase